MIDFSHPPDARLTLDDTGRVLSASSLVENLQGLTVDEFLPPEHAKRARNGMRDAMSAKQAADFFGRFTREHGFSSWSFRVCPNRETLEVSGWCLDRGLVDAPNPFVWRESLNVDASDSSNVESPGELETSERSNSLPSEAHGERAEAKPSTGKWRIGIHDIDPEDSEIVYLETTYDDLQQAKNDAEKLNTQLPPHRCASVFFPTQLLLQPLKVAIYEGDQLIRVEEMEDPRVAFIEQYNQMNVKRGRRAEPA